MVYAPSAVNGKFAQTLASFVKSKSAHFPLGKFFTTTSALITSLAVSIFSSLPWLIAITRSATRPACATSCQTVVGVKRSFCAGLFSASAMPVSKRVTCTPANLRSGPIHQDHDTSRLDPMRVPGNIWRRTGVGDVVRRRLGRVHSHVPMSARHTR